ncbi:hypothetical protein QCA50_003519 [Cerrena zonata]|uniref:HSF-type DNA-binding domain-containing protein n=1 Tax=Cerrena zonata TaxID=2478898 RepID=A0AAW0GL41_9APHY
MSDQQLALARATTGQSTHLSKAARQVVPPFLQKLYEIVNDPKNDELIRWSESGDSFYVLNHERFAREVLGRWFKHQKFTSFVRQLNMYGFHKIPHLQQGVLRSDSDTEPWHFEHPHFHRGQPDLLCLIQRKKQPTQNNADDIHLEAEPAPPHIPPQLANLSQGQLLDIHSVVNGIAAIKRHQQTISADLNELKSSNQHLWQEALAARERHKKHQDTINRILKFLAGVFGNGEHKHEASPDGIQRKRPRLMIGDVPNNEKRKAPTVEEVMDDDDRRSVSDSTAPFATIETPEPLIHSPSLQPSEAFSPTPSDISYAVSTPGHSTLSTNRPQDPLPRNPSNEVRTSSSNEPRISEITSPAPQNSSVPPLSSAITSNPNLQPNASNTTTPEMWATFQQILNSPGSMHQFMQALAKQQQFPMPSMPEAGTSQHPPPEENTISTVAPYMPYPLGYPPAYDWTKLRSDLPAVVSPAATTNGPSSSSASGSVRHEVPSVSPIALRHPDDALTVDPTLALNTERLHKAYEDSSQIDADVDALQYSINSLIENLGMDPAIIPSSDDPIASSSSLGTNGTGSGISLKNNVILPTPSLTLSDITDTPSSDPASVDFDFDAFFNELTSRQPPLDGSNDYGDVMDSSHTSGLGLGGGHFDPVTGIDSMDTSGVDDAQQERLTAFLEDAGSSAASPLAEKRPISTSGPNGKKRKSDVNELPPLVSNDEVPKNKKRR